MAEFSQLCVGIKTKPVGRAHLLSELNERIHTHLEESSSPLEKRSTLFIYISISVGPEITDGDV